MKKRSSHFLFLLIWSLSMACSTVPKTSGPSLTAQTIEAIPFGESKNSVEKKLGHPARIVVDRDNPNVEGWIYLDAHTGYQDALLSFNKETRALEYKFVIPQENEPEASVDFLLKEKYRGHQFTPIAYPQCGRDYFPSEAAYADVSNGILINYEKKSGLTLGIAWASRSDTEKTIARILQCPNREREK